MSKITATVYQNKKGATTVMLRLPMELALKLGVAEAEVEGMVRIAIAEALNDRRGEGQAS